MTVVTLQLSDDLVLRAKQAGVYDEQDFIHTIHEYLKHELTKQSTHHKKSSVYDFVMTLPKAKYAKDGLQIQQELRDEW